MRIMGLDYGSKTIGVAISDPLGITAQGIEIIRREEENKLRKSLRRVEELAKEYAGKIVIYKVNVDKQKELAALFNATSIPLFVFIPMKGDPQLFRGAADKATYKKAIDEFLLK